MDVFKRYELIGDLHAQGRVLDLCRLRHLISTERFAGALVDGRPIACVRGACSMQIGT